MTSPYASVIEAIQKAKSGKMLIIIDDETRENEGDLYFPASLITSEIINFMITFAKGLVCVPITQQRADQLNLKPMVPILENQEYTRCNFTISVDIKDPHKSGISASDRAATAKLLSSEKTKPEELSRPGHIFPLIGHPRGLLGRQGHTEAAIEISRLIGLDQSAVICEIIGSDGEMLRGKQLEKFAIFHELKIISIKDLIEYSLTK